MFFAILSSSIIHALLLVFALILPLMPLANKTEKIEIEIADNVLSDNILTKNLEKNEFEATTQKISSVQSQTISVPLAQPSSHEITSEKNEENDNSLDSEFDSALAELSEIKNSPKDEKSSNLKAHITSSSEKKQQELQEKLSQAEELLNEETFDDRDELLAQQTLANEKTRLEQQAKLAAEKRAELAQQEIRDLKNKREQEEARAAALARAEQVRAEAFARAQEQNALKNNSGGNGQSTQQNGLGSNQEVRSLAELKQVPGNERPRYDADDRLAQRQGTVIFYAYISNQGTASQVKLVQSSGHRNLDYKTLKAIRGWKFYPGQEGWVEIPFQWDLKGEPRTVGGTLRKVSQN